VLLTESQLTVARGMSTLLDLSSVPDILLDDNREPPADWLEDYPLLLQTGRVLATTVWAQNLTAEEAEDISWLSLVQGTIVHAAHLVADCVGAKKPESTIAKSRLL
jgi:hypothetical protein